MAQQDASDTDTDPECTDSTAVNVVDVPFVPAPIAHTATSTYSLIRPPHAPPSFQPRASPTTLHRNQFLPIPTPGATFQLPPPPSMQYQNHAQHQLPHHTHQQQHQHQHQQANSSHSHQPEPIRRQATAPKRVAANNTAAAHQNRPVDTQNRNAGGRFSRITAAALDYGTKGASNKSLPEEDPVSLPAEREQHLVSNITTSSDRLALLDMLYQGQRKRLLKKLKQLKEGTLDEWVQGVVTIDKECDRRLLLAVTQRDLHLDMVQRDFAAEKKRLKIEVDKQRGELKDNFVRRLVEAKAHARDLYEALSIEMEDETLANKGPHKKILRRRKEHEDEPELVVTNSKKRERDVNKSGPTITWELNDVDVEADMDSLFPKRRLVQQQQPLSQTRTELEAYYEDDKLYYDSKVFQRGMRVTVDYVDSDIREMGYIFGLNPGEVWIRQDIINAPKHRISIANLATGKCILKLSSGRDF